MCPAPRPSSRRPGRKDVDGGRRAGQQGRVPEPDVQHVCPQSDPIADLGSCRENGKRIWRAQVVWGGDYVAPQRIRSRNGLAKARQRVRPVQRDTK
jgi:hypothetical protein